MTLSQTSALSLMIVLAMMTTTLEAQTPVPGKQARLQKEFLGTWVLAGSPGNEVEPAEDAEMKFIGLGHFAVIKRNDETGLIDYNHVGTYTLDGNTYTETITHAIGATEQLVGQSFTFKIKIEGDTYVQEGVGNPWNQIWKRLGVDNKL